MSTTPRTDARLAGVVLLTVAQVADLLALHPRTVWRMVSAGELPAPIGIGARAKRWRLSDLTAWLDQQARTGGAR